MRFFMKENPSFIKHHKILSVLGIGCQLIGKHQLLLNNSTALHKPERSYQIQPHLQHKQQVRENKQHPAKNTKSKLS